MVELRGDNGGNDGHMGMGEGSDACNYEDAINRFGGMSTNFRPMSGAKDAYRAQTFVRVFDRLVGETFPASGANNDIGASSTWWDRF